MKKIVVIGSLNMDLVTQTGQLPRIGETVNGLAFRTVCGGKGANQAYAAARLGGSVAMLGCVGGDVFGEKLLHSLQETGADCSHIQVCEDTESGTASITVCQGDNAIIVVPGANALVSPAYIEAHLPALARVDLILLQLEIPLKTVAYITEYAARQKIPVMLNPAPAQALPPEIFPRIRYLILNETECAFYTGLPIRTPADAKEGLALLLAKGIGQVVVTLGRQGAVYNHAGSLCHTPARQVKAIDSTAAGDTFTAALAVSLLEGKAMPDAVDFATRASAIVVTRMGAQSSIPSREEL